jgi:hypothetical protein
MNLGATVAHRDQCASAGPGDAGDRRRGATDRPPTLWTTPRGKPLDG